MEDLGGGGFLHSSSKENAQHQDLVAGMHLKRHHGGKRQGEDKNIAGHVRHGCNFIHDVDVADTSTELAHFSPPIVGDGHALEDGREEDGDPPHGNVDSDNPDSNPKLAGGEDPQVEGQDSSLDERHCTGVEDLQSEHDLALRLQDTSSGEASRRAICAIGFYLTDAGVCDSHDVVDGDSQGDNLVTKVREFTKSRLTILPGLPISASRRVDNRDFETSSQQIVGRPSEWLGPRILHSRPRWPYPGHWWPDHLPP